MVRGIKYLAAATTVAAACALPHAAEAWVGGVFIAPPIVVGPPPAYYPPPPPAYYPPAYGYAPQPYGYAPPAGYTPAPQAEAPQETPAQIEADRRAYEQQQANLPHGATCYAGFYTCAARPNTHVGTGCSCPGIGAPSFGTVN